VSVDKLAEPLPFEVVMGYLPGADTTGPEITPMITTVAFVLWTRTWGAGSDAAVVVPAGTNLVTFDIRLGSCELTRFSVTLRDLVTNEIAWATDRVTLKVTADHASAIAAVPVRSLAPRHYMVELTGQHPDGHREPISRCPFELLAR
jgi:hypothetical protein